jgi:hypothetical protein
MREIMDWKNHKCRICKKYESENKNGMATHLRLKHDLHIAQYERVHVKGLSKKICEADGCDKEPSYNKSKQRFNDFCVDHANLARSRWSKENIDKTFGGEGPGWKKGLTKDDDESIARQAKAISGENNPWHTLAEEEKLKAQRKASKARRISESKYKEYVSFYEKERSLIIETPYSAYEKRSAPLDVLCLKCNEKFKRTLGNFIQYDGACVNCARHGLSRGENELAEFVSSLGENIIRHDRTILEGQELDIYLPEHQTAFEFNGLYWHSEQFKDKEYHRRKTDQCRANGVRLFHIWEDDWDNKEKIVKSMIKHLLGISQRIYARKCEIRPVDKKRRKEFFEENHLSGDAGARLAYGLFHNDELVACTSFRVPIHYNDGQTIEIARFANKLDTVVVGGFSKILKNAIDEIKSEYDRIVTYIDLDHGSYKDNVYSKNGFKYIKDTTIDYCYTDGVNRYSRWKFQTTDEKTEREQAKESDVYKLYGAGNRVCELTVK